MAHLNVRQFIIRRICFSTIALALAGCAPGLIRADLSNVSAPPAGKASIVVIRPYYLSYAARDLTITANNSTMADLTRSSYTSFLMSPGGLTLSGEGGFFSWPRRDITIEVKEGQTYYLAWITKETASSALMMYLFPTLQLDSLRWEVLSKEDVQHKLKDLYYAEPKIREIPK